MVFVRVLGAVFLVVTGGEALYADMGHFGVQPIRMAWFIVVFPALVLNYLGQRALLLHDPRQSLNPFYHLAPAWPSIRWSLWRPPRLNPRLEKDVEPLDLLLLHLKQTAVVRVPGTAVFVTGHPHGTLPMLLHHLERNQVLHERVVLLTVVTEGIPRVPASESTALGRGSFGPLCTTALRRFPTFQRRCACVNAPA